MGFDPGMRGLGDGPRRYRSTTADAPYDGGENAAGNESSSFR
jgi:hypothetical protein